MVSSSGSQSFFISVNVAASIFDKYEFSALNKMERDINGIMIKDVCWKLEVDRLGEVTNLIK